MTSVNTNYGALLALQSLNSTTKQLDQVQSRVTTGLKVANAKDNGAVFAIAEGLRTRVASLAAVKSGIDRANTAIDTALGAGQDIGDILKSLKAKADEAQGAGLNASQKEALQADFAALRAQIDQIANSATINGLNFANGTNAAGGVAVLTSDQGAAGGASSGFFQNGGDGGASFGTTLGLQQKLEGTLTISGQTVEGVNTDDYVTFTLLGPTLDGVAGTAGGGDDRTFRVDFETGDTIQDFLDRVNTQTNGAVTASFDHVEGRIVYQASQAFTAAYTDGAGTDTAADVEAIFTFTGTSLSFVAGGGYQTTTATRAASGTTLATPLIEIETTFATTDTLTFTFNSGDPDQVVFNVNFDDVGTLGDLFNKITQVTNGKVSASYDSVTRLINYRSDEEFVISNTTVTSGVILPTVLTAVKAPSSGGAGGGSATTTVNGYDFRVGKGSLSTVTATLDVSVDASAASTAIATAIDKLNKDLATLGSKSKALDVQKDFLTKLSDNIENGIGLLVDADLAKESARLQALQIKQQLGAQALSIANQQPSILLSFFR